jgi:hypothetical protein
MALNINNYINDGFQKVCNVKAVDKNHWEYFNIDQSLMYSDHRSWVYFIVENQTILKVGETGNPLGIRRKGKNESWSLNEPQPKSGSESRFGRYMNGEGTDAYVRETLQESIQHNDISLWAKKCDYVQTPYTIWNAPAGTALMTMHKDLEKKYIDFIVSQTYQLPLLNKGRA